MDVNKKIYELKPWTYCTPLFLGRQGMVSTSVTSQQEGFGVLVWEGFIWVLWYNLQHQNMQSGLLKTQQLFNTHSCSFCSAFQNASFPDQVHQLPSLQLMRGVQTVSFFNPGTQLSLFWVIGAKYTYCRNINFSSF